MSASLSKGPCSSPVSSSITVRLGSQTGTQVIGFDWNPQAQDGL